MTHRTRVAVLSGGPSGEHEVSLESGRQVVDALDPDRYLALSVLISPHGNWQIGRPQNGGPESGDPAILTAGSAIVPPSATSTSPIDSLRHGISLLQELSPDVVFIALHGEGGEDGVVQGLLDLTGLPYTGSGVRSSAVAFDKRLTKAILREAGVPVPPHLELLREELHHPGSDGRQRIREKIGIPCVVKIPDSGSSIGVHPVASEEDLLPALEDALARRPRCLVEPYLRGTELTVGVLGNSAGEGADAPHPLSVTEIVPRESTFFDYHAKYTPGASLERTPAQIDGPTTRRVQELGLRSHHALGCDGATRTDLILTDHGPVVLEINTIPGLTANSLLPQGAKAEGISFPELVERMIHLARVRQPQAAAVPGP